MSCSDACFFFLVFLVEPERYIPSDQSGDRATAPCPPQRIPGLGSCDKSQRRPGSSMQVCGQPAQPAQDLNPSGSCSGRTCFQATSALPTELAGRDCEFWAFGWGETGSLLRFRADAENDAAKEHDLHGSFRRKNRDRVLSQSCDTPIPRFGSFRHCRRCQLNKSQHYAGAKYRTSNQLVLSSL